MGCINNLKGIIEKMQQFFSVLLFVIKEWFTYWYSYALPHNDAKNMTPIPYYLHHLQILHEIDSFLKNFFNVCKIKNGKLYLLRANLYLIVWLIIFFLFFRGLQQKIEPSWSKHLFELENQAEHNTTNIKTVCTWLFIRNCNNVSGILDWTLFLHYSDCKNSSNSKLLHLWTSKEFS